MKLNKILSLSAAFFVVISSWFTSPSLALTPTPQAQTAAGINIEISPLPIELNAKPGQTVSADLRVRNSGSLPETLKTSIKTFTAEGADGHIVLHDPTPADEVTHWVSFDRTTFDAPPGLWQTVKMTVAVPKTAAFGYYYGVQFELANPPKAEPGKANLRGAVVIFVLLNAEAPGATRKVEVTSFKADHSSYEFLPANFSVALHNSGNLHVAAHGNIFIKKGSKQVAALPVNATEGLVLPGANRIFATSWSDGFPVYTQVTDAAGNPVKDPKGNIKTKLNWNFSKVSKLRFGHYQAQLLLIYNDGQRDIPITGSLAFWVIPWRLVAGLIVVLIFMGIGLWSTFKKSSRLVKRHTKRGVKDDQK
jgi:hypothetical protein